MDMNFRTGGDWGQAMVDAGQAVLDQLRRVHPDASEAAQNAALSLTIMIGRNDTGAVTKQADATKVRDFARSRGLGRLGLWSLGRDNGGCAGKRKAQPTCSGVAQKDREFTTILAAFQN
jgi:chitinase